MHKNNIKLNKYYAEKSSKTTGIEIQSQHCGGNRKLSMEGINIEYFTNLVDTGSNEKKSEFHSYISGDNDQDSCDSHAHFSHIFKNI